METEKREGLKVEQVAIAAIHEYDRNARDHSPEQVKLIARSIKEFGFVQPVLIDSEGVLIAGHGRLAAAKHNKMKEVPALRIENLTDAQVKAYRIADNRLTEMGTWNRPMLAAELEDLQGADFDVSLTGFELYLDFEDIRAPEDTPEEGDQEWTQIKVMAPSHMAGEVKDALPEGVFVQDSIEGLEPPGSDKYGKAQKWGAKERIRRRHPYTEGHLYVPFCGFGVLARKMEYPENLIIGCDHDVTCTDWWREHMPEARIENCNAEDFEFGEEKFTFADFDAFADPLPAVKNFLENANFERCTIHMTNGLIPYWMRMARVYSLEKLKFLSGRNTGEAAKQMENWPEIVRAWMQGIGDRQTVVTLDFRKSSAKNRAMMFMAYEVYRGKFLAET